MNAQDIMAASQLTRSRELQTALTRAAAENARLAAENAELTAHLDLAILAAEDLRALPEGGKLIIVDGWNMILGARPAGAYFAQSHDLSRGVLALSKYAPRSPKELIAKAQAHLKNHPLDFVWIVFDGPRENTRMVGGDTPGAPRLRISYTGGEGEHRADKFICDFLRMAKFRGSLERIVVETNDKDFRKKVLGIRG